MSRFWPAVQEIFRVLRPAWLAGLFVVGISAAFHISQALDALVDIARHGGVSKAHLSLLVAVLALAICGWYFPRALLYVKYWFTPEPNRPRFDRARVWIPRLLGILPILSLAAAFFRKSALGFGSFYLLVAVLFGALLLLRGRMFQKPPSLLTDLPGRTVAALIIILLVSLSLLVIFLNSRVVFPQMIGPIAIIVYATASSIAFGSAVLIYVSYRYRVPSLLVVALLVTIFLSTWNDNHSIQKGAHEEQAWHRSTVEEHLGKWIRHREANWRERFPEGEPYPLVLIAAEGGGIRAAYWTGSVLAKLGDTYPGFACHVFAISGVSGGSLGGAVFSALTAEALQSPDSACDGSQFPKSRDQLEKTRNILGKDFLGPALAGLLFPDFLQRFNPFGDQVFSGRLAFPDRAQYLESSWEAAWQEVAQSSRFEDNFRRLWAGHELEVPSLFMNGTWVASGARHVTSNLRPASPKFVELDDAVEALDRPLPLSTAVHMSARFTYVSPAGTMPDGRRVVDGGYFENSGAMTASELLSVVSESRGTLNFEPFVVIITNAPENPNRKPGRGGDCGRKRTEPATGESPGAFNETLVPIVTLLHTRSARGYRAEKFLERLAPGRVYRFDLPASENAEVPLGWILSEDSRAFMDCEIDHLEGIERIMSPERRQPDGDSQSPGTPPLGST